MSAEIHIKTGLKHWSTPNKRDTGDKQKGQGSGENVKHIQLGAEDPKDADDSVHNIQMVYR